MKRVGRLLVYLFVLSLFLTFAAKKDVQAKVIYTTNDKVNAAAEKIISSCTTEKMTRAQKLRAVYMYLVSNMRYSYHTGKTRVKVSSADMKKLRKVEKQLKKEGKLRYSSSFHSRYNNVMSLQGTCYGMSMVFCILANHLGYSARMCHGRYVSGHSSNDHYWCYVVMDGKKKYFDVQIANHFWLKSHSMSRVDNYYCKSKNSSIWRKYHRG